LVFLRATAEGKPSLPAFSYHGDPADCYFTWDKTTLDGIYDIGKASGGAFDRYLVVHHPETQPTVYGGCAVDDVMFVTDNVFPKTMAHEMGHAMVGLYDENGSDAHDGQFCLKWRNCATSRTDLPWTPQSQTGPEAGCDGFNDLFHPTATCRMIKANESTFCHVCLDYIHEALNGSLVMAPRPKQGKGCDREPLVPDPWLPGKAVHGSVDIVAAIGRTSDEIKVLDILPSTVNSLAPRWITGDVFAVASDGSEIVGIQPIAADHEIGSLMGRAYGVNADDEEEAFVSERSVPVPAQLIRLTLPGISMDQIESRGLTLRLRYLRNARRFGVVDNAIAGQLAALPVAGVVYDLQEAILRR
jgi:hypothetical protein